MYVVPDAIKKIEVLSQHLNSILYHASIDFFNSFVN